MPAEFARRWGSFGTGSLDLEQNQDPLGPGHPNLERLDLGVQGLVQAAAGEESPAASWPRAANLARFGVAEVAAAPSCPAVALASEPSSRSGAG